jgi:hypothetical protein
MKTYKIEITIRLDEGATDWIPQVIEEQLSTGEAITEYNITEETK